VVYEDIAIKDPGDEDMSDADWDDWICDRDSEETQEAIKTETDRRFPIVSSQR
jgi:hypothetical protein